MGDLLAVPTPDLEALLDLLGHPQLQISADVVHAVESKGLLVEILGIDKRDNLKSKWLDYDGIQVLALCSFGPRAGHLEAAPTNWPPVFLLDIRSLLRLGMQMESHLFWSREPAVHDLAALSGHKHSGIHFFAKHKCHQSQVGEPTFIGSPTRQTASPHPGITW